MADGDPITNDGRIACDYVSDTGQTFRFRALERNQAQAGLGWVASTDEKLPPPPKGLKPRKVLCYNDADAAHAQKKALVVATAAAFDAIVIGTTTFKVKWLGVEQTFLAYGKSGERFRGRELD